MVFCTEFLDGWRSWGPLHRSCVWCTICTIHMTYAAALKTATHPETRCRKPYAATQHLMLLMMGVCTRNMSSYEYTNKITLLHQVGFSHYFMRKMHGQTTLKKYFDVCSLFRFVMLKSYLQWVTIRTCDVCITLKNAFWKCMLHWFTFFPWNALSIKLVRFVYMETNLIVLHMPWEKIVNSLIMKLYNFTQDNDLMCVILWQKNVTEMHERAYFATKFLCEWLC